MKEVLTQLEQMGAQLAQIGQRLDRMDGRFDQVDGRLDRVDGRFEQVEGILQKQGVLLEAVSADVKMALEGIAGNREVMDKEFADMAARLDVRVEPIEQASRHFARTLAVPGGNRPRRKKRV